MFNQLNKKQMKKQEGYSQIVIGTRESESYFISAIIDFVEVVTSCKTHTHIVIFLN